MTTAKIFENGRSQAVRLPKEFRFEENEVAINLNYSWSHKRFRNIQTYDDNNKHTAITGKVINKKGRLLPWSAETAEIIKVQL